MLFERYLRKRAYELLTARDNYHGVMAHKKDFLSFASDNIELMQAYSFEKLRYILSYAYKTSPYYNGLWKEIGFDPQTIKCPEDVAMIPCLTKDVIEKNKEKMISKMFRANDLEISYTGGSSGTPTSFYRDRACTAMRIGRQWGILELCGYSPGDRCGFIWGVHEDLPDSTAKPSLKRSFRKFASGKEALCCTIMNSEKMTEFHARLRRFKPKVLYGYPNAMAQFATFVKERDLPPIRVKTIISTAERLTEEQRKILSDVFGGEVFNLYCTREHGCIGFECGKHSGFHLDIGSVHLEIISDAGPARPRETGEIVITDLLNSGMPFVRYKIGDRGQLSSMPCGCGCQLPLMSAFDGRVTDLLYRADGSTVAGVMLVDMFLDEPAIRTIQIVQESLNEINLLLVVSETFNKDIEQRAIKELRKYVGQEMKVNVKIVPEIPRNPISGKYQEVICRVRVS